MVIKINEKTSMTCILSFRDENKVLVEPSTVSIVLKSVMNNTEINTFDLTDLIKIDGPKYQLKLTKSDNELVGLSSEKHVLIVDWSYNNGMDEGATSTLLFLVNKAS